MRVVMRVALHCTIVWAAIPTALQLAPSQDLDAQEIPPARVTPLPVALELGGIRWAFQLPRDRVIFADHATNMVHVRESNGSTTQLGRHGDGPGEYRAPENGVLKGDSILVFAAGLSQRTAVHLQTGTGTRRQMLGVTPDAACRALVLLTSEGVCELPKRGDPRATDHYRTYMRFNTRGSGAQMTPLYRSYDTAHVARLVSGTTTRHLARPIVWGPTGAASPDATLMYVLEQTDAGPIVQVVVTVTGTAHGRRTVHRWTASPTVVTNATIRAEARRRVEEMSAQGHPVAAEEARAISQMVTAWAAPRSAPPFRRILGSDDGCFWLERSRPLGSTHPASTIYDRYDSIGRPLASLSIPFGLLLNSVTCTTAVGSRLNGDDVPELVRVSAPS